MVSIQATTPTQDRDIALVVWGVTGIQDRMAQCAQEIEIPVPPEVFFATIIDFSRYPEFLPEVSSIEIVERDGDHFVVAIELQLVMKLSYILELDAEPPNRLTWKLREGRMFSRNNGSWTLTPTAAGTTIARYELDVAFLGLLPRSVSDHLAGVTLPQTLSKFAAAAQRAVTEKNS